MSNNWTADVVGRMHIAKITGQTLARECGYNASYVSEVLNGKRGTDETKQRILDALRRLEDRLEAKKDAEQV